MFLIYSALERESAASGGGEIYTEHTLTIRNSQFVENSASPHGGAIAYTLSSAQASRFPLVISDSSFTGNMVCGTGGAIWIGTYYYLLHSIISNVLSLL